jgi:site-specific recombinase XerD
MSSELEAIDPRPAKELSLDERRHEGAQATLQAHEYGLKQSVDWCEDDGIENPNELSGRDVDRFRVKRREDGVATATMEGQLATLRMGLGFSATMDAVESGLAEVFIPHPPPVRRHPMRC